MRDVAIVATGMTPFGELWQSSLRQMFVDAALPPIDSPSGHAGASWGDCDNDGDLDLGVEPTRPLRGSCCRSAQLGRDRPRGFHFRRQYVRRAVRGAGTPGATHG